MALRTDGATSEVGSPAERFAELSRLKNTILGIRQNQVRTLGEYVSRDHKGFCHQLERPETASLASTATCVSSLVNAGRWTKDFKACFENTAAIAAWLASKRSSASLRDDNPFSLAFAAEGLLDLAAAVPGYEGAAEHRDYVETKLAPILAKELKNAEGKFGRPGAISVDPYPPSAYLTQLVFRVLRRCGGADRELNELVHGWSRAEINKQVALIAAQGSAADPMQLAYSLILAVTTIPAKQNTPEDKEIFRHALSVFFAQQRPDGLWPRSRPMFHYKEVGSAYCFEYELLAQLLSSVELRNELLGYFPQLLRSTSALARSEYDLDPENPGKKTAWASGHHPQYEGPESWSTASVFQFAHALDRLVAEGVRRILFEELNEVYPGPPKTATAPPDDDSTQAFAPSFLDTTFRDTHDEIQGLKATLATRFVFPIAREAPLVERGGKLGNDTPMSAILFGPPGTSKTELAKIIANYLGWPLLPVDPSYLVQEGLDQIQAMANRLFSMLVTAEQVVVLLDEFDEMGRDRARNEELLSRFITTAMLPKLAAINKERKIVFLLATNFVSGFDAAFSRGGRFDMLLPVMPPTSDAKLNAPDLKPTAGWAKTLQAAVAKLGPDADDFKSKLADLTFTETAQLVRELAPLLERDPVQRETLISAMQDVFKFCTMERTNDIILPNDEPKTAVDQAAEVRPNDGSQTAVDQAAEVQSDGARPRPTRPTWRMTCEIDARQVRIPVAPDRRTESG